ncbi:hypothetical protein JNM05_04535 [bacterium]|nr:hypothetical protein [bacterium]
MIISLIDRSNYLRGLLILIRKDRKISGPEKDMMMRIGKALDFNEEFCEKAIHEILDNEYITDEPPVFESHSLSMMFIRDGLRLGLCDHDALHAKEEEWLKRTAKMNGLDSAWFDEQVSNADHYQSSEVDFEAYHLAVE